MIHVGILRYANNRYLWWSLALVVVSAVLYSTQGGFQPANGGTWQGYVLGTVGALLIVWLLMLGIRKRSYSSSLGSVAGWTSAHVYLGTALLIIATLHSAGQLGWNVHSLAYLCSQNYSRWTIVPGNSARKALMTSMLQYAAPSNARRLAVVFMPSWLARTSHASYARRPEQIPTAASRLVTGTSNPSSISSRVAYLKPTRLLKPNYYKNFWKFFISVALLIALVIHIITTFIYW